MDLWLKNHECLCNPFSFYGYMAFFVYICKPLNISKNK